MTSPWSSGKCVRFGAGRSRVRLFAGCYQDLVNWCCSLLTRRTVCGRAAGNSPKPRKKTSQLKPDIVQTQTWRYKTIVVIKRQQQTTISKNQSETPRFCVRSATPWQARQPLPIVCWTSTVIETVCFNAVPPPVLGRMIEKCLFIVSVHLINAAWGTQSRDPRVVWTKTS